MFFIKKKVCFCLAVFSIMHGTCASSCHAVHSKGPFILIPNKTNTFFQIYIMIMLLLFNNNNLAVIENGCAA